MLRLSARFATAGLALLGWAVMAPAMAGVWELRSHRVPVQAIDAGTVEVLSAAADPSGKGLVILDRDDRLWQVSWTGTVARLSGQTADGAPLEHPLSLHSSPEHLLLVQRAPPAIVVLNQDLAVAWRLPARLLRPFGLHLVGSRLVVIGEPIVPASGEEPHWDDPAWRRQRLRSDCGIFTVDLDSPGMEQQPSLCDPLLGGALRRALPGGYVTSAPGTDRWFAALEGRPTLVVLDAQGGLVREVSLLGSGETVPELSERELHQQFATRDGPLELRDRLPWVVGLLRYERKVGVITRRWDGQHAHFSVDLFDDRGERLAEDLDLGLSPAGRYDHLIPIPLPDGRMLLLYRERTADGSTVAQRLLEVRLASKQAETAIDQTAAARLRFRLLDEQTAEPILKAWVEVAEDKRTRRREVRSTDGDFSEARLGGGPARLSFEAEGYLTVELEVDLSADTDLGTIYLDPGAQVVGNVLHREDATPVVGAAIEHARPHRWGSLAAKRFGRVDSVASDAQGRFRLSGLRPGPACLKITPPGAAPMAVQVDAVAEGESRQLGTLLLHPARPLTGSVVDGAGQPLAASVELRAGSPVRPCLRLRAVGGDDGRFRFPQVRPGNYHLVALIDHQLVAARPLVVPTGERARDVGTLEAAVRRVVVRVTIDGQPAPGEWVTLQPAESGLALPMPVFWSDGARQQEVLSDLPPRVTALPDLEQPGRFEGRGHVVDGEALLTYRTVAGQQFRFLTTVSPGSKALSFRLDLSGRDVEGMVLDELGNAVAGATVQLLSGDLWIRAAATGTDGRFTLAAIAPGDYRLRAATGGLQAEQPLQIPGSASDEPPRSAELRLAPRRSAVLEVVLASAGTAQQPRTAVLLTDGKAFHRVLAGRDTVRFAGLAAGNYQVAAFREGGLSAAKPVRVDAAQTVRIGLPPALSHPIQLDLGAAAAGRYAVLLTEQGASVSALMHQLGYSLTVSPEGLLDLPPLASGHWLLRWLGGPIGSERPFRVRAGQPVVQLRLPG